METFIVIALIVVAIQVIAHIAYPYQGLNDDPTVYEDHEEFWDNIFSKYEEDGE